MHKDGRYLDKLDHIAKSRLPVGQIVSQCTDNVPVAPMRRCVIRRCLDKSDRIGIETRFVFHCATVSSSDIFGAAVSAHEKRFGGKV